MRFSSLAALAALQILSLNSVLAVPVPDAPPQACGAVAGNAGASTGSAGTSTGNAGASTGSSGVNTGSSGASAGNSDASTGNAGTSTGNSGVSTGNTGSNTGNSGTATGSAGSAGNAGAATGSSGTTTGSSGTTSGSSGTVASSPSANTGNSGVATGNAGTDTATTYGTVVDTSGIITDDAGSTAGSSGPYWVSNIQRQGTVAFGDASYQVFRNVKTCGAKGDGVTDDTAAINNCISQGSRCGQGCDSTTLTPALVYFPPGTYLISKPLIQLYYTQFVGDAVSPPTLKAAGNFAGIALIDSDPYDNQGNNWYTNQNNFFRQVRNFVIDLTGLPMSSGTGIHWQVAQATSLQNIVFNMVQGGGSNNKQQGVFMDNGSGGFMADLTFNGGNYGMFLGNQQFTTRNLKFNNCNTAIFMNWNWLWNLKSVQINNCGVGVDMANSPSNQTVGSIILQDSKIINTKTGITTAFSSNSVPATGGTLIIDNVDFTGTTNAVVNNNGQQYLAGNRIVQAWAQGRAYAGSAGSRVQGNITPAAKPVALLNGANIFERSKPQYQAYPASAFVSVKSKGARGDGNTDDTAAIQNAMNSVQANQVLYFDHGAYVITSTIKVPKNIKITGEIWPLIMASGSFFGDQNNPKPVFQVGQAGDVGAVEMSDLIFETKGPAPGAVLMEWNSAASAPGANGLWDVHFRVGGSAGTQLQSNTCSKNPNAQHGANPACIGAHTMFHATKTSSAYVENCWFWVADHELDLADHNQVDIYNGRGVRIESQGPMWFYGTSSEHSQLYNYQLTGAKSIYMGLIQTETPYMQPNPPAPGPFTPSAAIGDPTFGSANSADNMAWGLRIVDSSDILVYGAGLYSFFQNYNQACLAGENCQSKMVSVEGTSKNLNLFGLSTKAAANMVSTTSRGITVGNGQVITNVNVPDSANRDNFCATVALWRPI